MENNQTINVNNYSFCSYIYMNSGAKKGQMCNKIIKSKTDQSAKYCATHLQQSNKYTSRAGKLKEIPKYKVQHYEKNGTHIIHENITFEQIKAQYPELLLSDIKKLLKGQHRTLSKFISIEKA